MNAEETVQAALEAAGDFVTDYRDDLKIDAAAITANPGVPFIYVVRKLGTFLFFMHEAASSKWPPRGVKAPFLFGTATREHILNGEVRALAGRCKEPEYRYFYFNGKTFTPLEARAAFAVYDNYAIQVRRAWSV